jgi:hypothetical protein
LSSLPAFLKFKPGLTESEQKQAFSSTSNMLPRIPAVKNFHVGPPVSFALTQGYDYGEYNKLMPFIHINSHSFTPALFAEFEDLDAFRQYTQCEEHRRLARDLKRLMDGM